MALPGYLKNPPKWLYIGIFILIAVAIIIIGYVFVQNRAAAIKKEKHGELTIIAKLKVDQVIRWRNERLNDAFLLSRDIFVSGYSSKSVSGINSDYIKQLSLRFANYLKTKEYVSLTLYDSSLNYITGNNITSVRSTEYLESVLNKDKPEISNVFYNKENKTQFIEIYIPLVFRGNNKGLIVARVDPEASLFPIVESWPAPSNTSEVLLVYYYNDSVYYLNRPRHLDKSKYPFGLPVKGKKFTVSKSDDDIIEGFDYRGVEVLADLKEIPDSKWFVVTKIDQEEVFSSVYNMYSIVIFIVNLLVFSTAVTLGLLWRNKSANFYKQLYNMETKQKELLQQYEFITKNANVIILLLDLEGNIIYANESASRLYGFTINELEQMNIADIRVEEESPSLSAVFEKIKEKEGYEYEVVHKTRSGELVYMDVGARQLSYGGKDVIICIFRNITEKKRAEDLIRKALSEKEMLLKEVHHRVKNNLQTISSLLGLQSAMIDDEKIRRIFSDSQIRIKSMALLHQSLYSDNAEFVNSQKYFSNLLQNLMTSYNSQDSRITLDSLIDEVKISVDHATTLGLIITEIISNIFKHAFPGNRSGIICFRFQGMADSGFMLTISDNGIGLPADFNVDINSGLGMRLIQLLPKQIGATINIHNKSGTTFVLECPNN